MASILIAGSFLVGSLLSILLPLALLIALLLWHGRAIIRVPHDPGQGAVHAAGAAEREGSMDAGETGPSSTHA